MCGFASNPANLHYSHWHKVQYLPWDFMTSRCHKEPLGAKMDLCMPQWTSKLVYFSRYSKDF